MSGNPNNIIANKADCSFCGAHAIEVHHRDFPELRVKDASASRAAALIAERLASDLDAVSDPLHRDPVRRAILDAQAFLKREHDLGDADQ